MASAPAPTSAREPRPAPRPAPAATSAALAGLGTVRARSLAGLGIATVPELLAYPPLHGARMLVAAARSGLPARAVAQHLTPDFAGRDPGEAPGWPLAALAGLARRDVGVLAAIGIGSVGELAALGDDADRLVLAAFADNGFRERPSAPAELLPAMVGAVATSVRYSSFVQETELRGHRLRVHGACRVPLALTAEREGKQPGDPPQLADAFTKISCPVLRLGYLCDHRQRWIHLGTHLGEVVHSLSLAPGESRNVAVVNWRRRQLTALEEHTTTSEQLTATFVQNRAIDEVTSAVAREHQAGRTSASANNSVTAASFVGAGALVGGGALGVAGAVVGGIAGAPTGGSFSVPFAIAAGAAGAVVGGAAGAAAGGLVFAGANALGMIEAASEGDRDVAADLQQRITLATSQRASAVRSLWSSVVVEDAQAERVEVTASNVTNYNHMHALNLQYHEVLQRYLVQLEVVGAEPVLYLPFTFFDFTGFRFVRDYWEAVRLHVEDEQLRHQGDAYFVHEAVPTTPDLLAVPPLPSAPGGAATLSIRNLELELVFRAGSGLGGILANLLSDVDLQLVRGGDVLLATPADGVAFTAGLNADEKGKRFTFGDVADAGAISAVRLVRSQAFNTDVDFRIRVRTGELRDGGGTVESLANRSVATNRRIAHDDTQMTRDVGWSPASSALLASANAQAAYNAAVANRNAILATNEQRQAAYDALVADMQRFEQRLDRLVRRRRHFFTRVILAAVEPEELVRLLDTLRIEYGAGGRQGAVPLHVVAHTTPLGMTSGAFVLRLRRVSREWLAREGRFASPAPELVRLLGYADDVAARFAAAERAKLARADQVHLPSGGVFAEAILGRANGAEYVDFERYFNWQDSPIPHQAPAVQPVGAESRFQATQSVDPTVPGNTITIQAPAALPDPSGMQGVLAAIQNGGMFRDMSKASELAGVMTSLAALSGQMGQAASTMTGQAAQQAMQAATQAAQMAAQLAQGLFAQTMSQAGTAFGAMAGGGKAPSITELAAIVGQAGKLAPPGGVGATDGAGGGADGSGTDGNGTDGNGAGGAPPARTLQEETFRELFLPRHDGTVFAGFPDGAGPGGTPGAGGAPSPTAQTLQAIAAEFPGLDPTIGEPSARNCCALFPGGVMTFYTTEYLDLARVPGHRYGTSGFNPADSVGHVYTARGGFVDLGHVRDLADTTRYLATRALAMQRDGGELSLQPEGGIRRLRITGAAQFPNVELAALVGARAAYDLAIWHEIVTWFTSIRHSSFSPEDNYSNLLGTLVGAAAATTRRAGYDGAVDTVLVRMLEQLGAQPRGTARQAIDAVAGLWYDPQSDLTAALLGAPASNRVLLRRHLDPLPTVAPWLVSDLHGVTFTVPDPVAGPGVDHTIDFDLGAPSAQPLAVPVTTSSGQRLDAFYDVVIDVDTSVVPTRVLPDGRTRLGSADLAGIVARLRPEILGEFPNGDRPADG